MIEEYKWSPGFEVELGGGVTQAVIRGPKVLSQPGQIGSMFMLWQAVLVSTKIITMELRGSRTIPSGVQGALFRDKAWFPAYMKHALLIS